MASDDEEVLEEEEETGEFSGDDREGSAGVEGLFKQHVQASTCATGDLKGKVASIPSKTAAKKKPKKVPPIRINLSNCKYEVLRVVQRKLQWKEVGDDEDWEIYWTDTSVSIERIMKLSKTQKINHFNGMLEICRKKSMARNLAKMQKLFPEHYDFFPRTFILPNDMQDLMADIKAKGKKQIYILKPDAGCQGRGIRLVQGGKEEAVAKILREMDTPNVVAQHYLAKPLLVHGYKFDMRIYALVLSCDPLRVFIFREGLARFCTEKYTKPKAENLSVSYMHLTNYAVNKHNEHFVANQGQSDDASKWTLEQLANHMNSQGHNWEAIWERIQQLIVKSLVSVQPVLRNNYRSVLPPDNDGFSCFEILGYDVMLDRELRPWLIEVNHSPSFNIDSPLDLAIKEELITDTIQLARIDPKLIAKAKKMEKRAAAGRLLEPLQKKKAAEPAAKGSTGAVGSGGDKGGAGPSTHEKGAAPAEKSAVEEAVAAGKPRTAEEYEAWRAEVLRKRDRYEAKHSGGYTRIYPTNDRTLQGLYEELLRGSAELFQSTFQAKAKRALDSLGEERKAGAAKESDSVKAEKAKSRALRDKLAQMALERRAKKAADKQQAGAMGRNLSNMQQQGGVLAGYVPGVNGMMYMQQGGQYTYYGGSGVTINGTSPFNGGLFGGVGRGVGGGGAPVGLGEAGGVFAIAGTQPRSEQWGESEASWGLGAGSVPSSAPSSRPVSARSVTGEPLMYYRVNAAGQLQHLTPAALARQQQQQQAAAAAQSNTQQQGALPPQPFRPPPLGGWDCGCVSQAVPANTPATSARAPGSAVGVPPTTRPNNLASAAASQLQQPLGHGAAAENSAAAAAGGTAGAGPGSTAASSPGYVALSTRGLSFQYPGQSSAQATRPGSASRARAATPTDLPGGAAATRAPTPHSPRTSRTSIIEKLQPGGCAGEGGSVSSSGSAGAGAPGAGAPDIAAASGTGLGGTAAAAVAVAGVGASAGAAVRGKPIPSIHLHEVTQLDEGLGAWAVNLGSAAHVPLQLAPSYARPQSAGSAVSGSSGVCRSRSTNTPPSQQTLYPVGPVSADRAQPQGQQAENGAAASNPAGPLYQVSSGAGGALLMRSPSHTLASPSRLFAAHMASISGSGAGPRSLQHGQLEVAGSWDGREQAGDDCVQLDGERAYGMDGMGVANLPAYSTAHTNIASGSGVDAAARSKLWPPPLPHHQPSPHPELRQHITPDPMASLPAMEGDSGLDEGMLYGAAMAFVNHNSSYTPVPPTTPAVGERGDLRGPWGQGTCASTTLLRSNSSHGNTAPSTPLARVYISAPTSLSPSPAPGQPSAAATASAATGFTVRSLVGTPKAAPKGGSLYTSLRPAPGGTVSRPAGQGTVAAAAQPGMMPFSMYGVLSSARPASARQRVLSVMGSSVVGRRSAAQDGHAERK